jgi:N-acetylmuramoyl-L-alanine amidase
MAAVLSGVKKHIIVNAGHFSGDPGASGNGYTERDEVEKIRDQVLPLLTKAGFSYFKIVDSLNLVQAIAAANADSPNLNDALAIDIHLNFASNTAKRGVEGYYGNTDASKAIAAAIAANVAKELGVPNGGAHPQSDSAVGSLGWIRETKVWATLVEVCYISNLPDMTLLAKTPGGYQKAALGIVNGICELYGVPKISIDDPNAVLKGRLDTAIADAQQHVLDLQDIRKSIT